MAHELQPLDISRMPDVARLADEVHRTRRSRVLRHGDTDIAVLMPATAARDEGTAHPPIPRGSRVRRDLRVVERTAGALKRYAKQPPATIAEEKAAFAQGVADEVAASLRR